VSATRWTVSTPADFDFAMSVCSHGFFMLAPNRWEPDTRTLRTTTPLDDHAGLTVVVREKRGGGGVSIHCADAGSADARAAARTRRTHASECVRRMLRLDEDLTEFHRLCRRHATHRPAAARRFGRLLRGATLFEDIVKIICTCNTAWRQTTAMVDKLVARYGLPCVNDPTGRAFPTPACLATVSATELRRNCSLGYRSRYVSDIARSIAEGDMDLRTLEGPDVSTDALAKRLRALPGIGEYGAANLCMLLGRYDRLAVDTEMVRFFRDRTGRTLAPAALRRRYNAFAPYQFLAYWWELWSGYTAVHGPAEAWERDGVGRRITDTNTARRQSGGAAKGVQPR
jgi:3-methyladenine DNA glycosylase/8-oxoguanine DNA glycosylase